MNFAGRLICTLIGMMVGGPIGALIGFGVGHFFDKSLSSFSRQFDPALREKVEAALFDTVFPLLGKLAKSDGRISEEEIGATEQLMSKMRLSEAQRQRAIDLFKQGSQTNYDISKPLTEFMAVCGAYPDVKQILLVYLLSLAMADGELADEEEALLRQVAEQLGYARPIYEQILRMAKAQQQFHGQGGGYGGATSSADQINNAYAALGMDSNASDAELKKRYRKLMSEYHPDKLIGQGVPDDMVKVATEKSQEIQSAYDLIKKVRANP